MNKERIYSIGEGVVGWIDRPHVDISYEPALVTPEYKNYIDTENFTCSDGWDPAKNK